PDETEINRERATVDQLRDLPVLIVDDNQTNRVILEEMLTNWSMSPTPVESAQRAMQQLSFALAQKKSYPLVIVDALMPETDGFMLLEQAQKAGLLDTATILMLSSADHQIFYDRCEGLDISAFLEKPVSQSDLLDAIMTALKGPQLERETIIEINETKQSLNILVAEDTPANQKVITAILKKRGHNCVIANNGREAIECLRSKSFDIVLMDVQMPTMDGLQATAKIREQEVQSNDHIPIIAMTAYAMRGDREKCIAAGMDSYISKPINAKKLIHLLEEYANNSTKRRSAFDNTTNKSSSGKASISDKAQRATKADAPGIEQPVINMRAALKRVGDDVEILNDMVNYFFEDYSVLLQEVRHRAEIGDVDEMVRAAHSLKGLCANFDAQDATKAAKTLETIGQTDNLVATSKAIDILESELDRLTAALNQWQLQNS
ncbi:MAG: response regulator, partial [Planctomycetota bacterium]